MNSLVKYVIRSCSYYPSSIVILGSLSDSDSDGAGDGKENVKKSMNELTLFISKYKIGFQSIRVNNSMI